MRLAVIALSAITVACSNLPVIEGGVCGNRVLDDGEDCDGFGRDGLTCRPPEVGGACQLDCSPQPDGTRTRCPRGYGCDAQFACRAATGTFVALPGRIAGDALGLGAADFDADGRDEVFERGLSEAAGPTSFRVHHFDGLGDQRGSRRFHGSLLTPSLLPVPEDARASLAYVREGHVGVLAGTPGGALISEALPSHLFPETQAHAVAVLDRPLGGASGLVVALEPQGRPGLHVERANGRGTRLLAALPFALDQLAGAPVAAHLFDDRTAFPCRDLVLARRGGHVLHVYSPCELEAEAGEVVWSAPEQVRALELELSPRAPISHAPIVGDLDGDGHRDLLIGTEEGTYVAFGDGVTFDGPRPIALCEEGPCKDEPSGAMPLAIGDLSGDGRPDLIWPHAIALARPDSEPRRPAFRASWAAGGERWTRAVVADFNRDGWLDAATASRDASFVRYFNGAGMGLLNPLSIGTASPVKALAYADFDGDLVNDLVVVEQGTERADGVLDDVVRVAFGNPAGPPGPGLQTVARLPTLQEVVPLRRDDRRSNAALALVFAQQDSGDRTGTALSILAGHSDRSLSGMLPLVASGPGEAPQSMTALAVTAGTFAESGGADVVALGVSEDDGEPRVALWWLPRIAGRRGEVYPLSGGIPDGLLPERLEARLPPGFALASGDLDGDGVDEVVMAGPGRDSEADACVLAVARVDGSGRAAVATSRLTLLPDCRRDTQLRVLDMDADGQRDVLLVSGAQEEERSLQILWGDGTPELDPERSARPLAGDAPPPHAIAALDGYGDIPGAFAFVASHGVFMVASDGPREFRAPERLSVLEAGTGVAAADVNGDGLLDLAAVDGGALRILRAELKGAP